MPYKSESFVNWLNSRLREENWSQSELARRSGIARPHISRILTAEREPGLDFYRKVAWALRLPLCEVLAAAGEVSSPPAVDSDLAFLGERLALLPEPKRKQAYDVIHSLVDVLTRYDNMAFSIFTPSNEVFDSVVNVAAPVLHDPGPAYAADADHPPTIRTREDVSQFVKTLSLGQARELYKLLVDALSLEPDDLGEREAA